MMESAIPQEMSARLESLRQSLPAKGRVLIIPHDYPDPDALASAAAMELLLARHFGLRGRIVFTGMVSRAENKELLKHFRYHWWLTSQVKPSRNRIPAVFIDTAPWSGNVTIPPYARPVGVIDHHLPSRKNRRLATPMFIDIRSGSGSTASIMYEYLQAAGISIPPWMASIVVYAIATETLDLSRDCTDDDRKVYRDLMLTANMSILGRIRHAPLPRSYYALLREAVDNALVFGRVAWSHLESIHQPEIIAETADLLLRAERVQWAFCTAFHGDSLLISLRSRRLGSHCGLLLKQIMKKDGSAGGHHQMAAGSIPMEGWPPDRRKARRQELVRHLIRRLETRSEGLSAPESFSGRPLADRTDP